METNNTHIYSVECSSGTWDDFRSWVAGIFDSKDKAEEYAKYLNENAKMLREVECPIKKPLEDMTEEDETKYYEWWDLTNDAMDFNGAKVKEYELNERLGE
jgi:hypothetical protein